MRNSLSMLALCAVSVFGAHALAGKQLASPTTRILVQIEETSWDFQGNDALGISQPVFVSERIIARPLINWETKNPELVRELGLDRYFRVAPAKGWGWGDVLSDLPEGSVILGIDPRGELHFDETVMDIRGDEFPDDSLFPQQYGLGEAPFGIGSLGAWRETYGSEEVVIAIVDLGVSSTHPDLASQLVEGYSALDGSSNTDDGTASHGTHVAGIAAASTDNGFGMAGVSRGSKIMPIKTFYSSGFGLETDVAEGIVWATDHGADVISMSFGFKSVLGPLPSAIQYAYDNGVVLVASTGNVPSQTIGFPAKYATVIGVGATGRDGLLWSNSSTGSSVMVVAPGESILSTWDTPTNPHSYRTESGTSMATPHVAGLAGLILSIAPELTPDEVMWVMRETSTDLGAPGIDNQYGAGMVNARDAVHAGHVLATSSCRADLTGDGFRDSADIAAFVDAYLNGSPTADLAIPFGILDLEDIQRFLDLYINGCDSN